MFGYIYLSVLFVLFAIIPILLGYDSTKTIHAVPRPPSKDDMLAYIMCSIFWPLLIVLAAIAGLIWLIEEGSSLIGKTLFNIGVRLARKYR